MAKFFVWGRGESSSEIVRSGEYSDAAAHAAGENGFTYGPSVDRDYDDTWYVEVECDEVDLNAQTRFDRATVGFCRA